MSIPLAALVLTAILSAADQQNGSQEAATALEAEPSPLVAPAFTDDEIAAYIETVDTALDAGKREVGAALRSAKFVASLARDSRSLSDEQAARLVAALEAFKAAHPDHAEALDRTIFQIANLSIGRTAPNIIGADTDGVEFELDAHRGRVVVIIFNGDW